MKHTAFSVRSEMNIMQITVSSFLLRMRLTLSSRVISKRQILFNPYPANVEKMVNS